MLQNLQVTEWVQFESKDSSIPQFRQNRALVLNGIKDKYELHHKVNLSSSGYNDAFIVAFKDGKRITLKEAGFELNPDYEDNIEIETEPSVNPINAKLVKFRVQVGAYKEKIPTDALDMYLDIGNVLPKRDIMTGLTKYYLGEFNNYDVAADFRLKLIDKGLVDCFVVGEFKNNIISTKEAKSLLGQ